MRQERRDERRRTIGAAVARIAAEHGVSAVSLRSVASESGASMGQIQHHFATVTTLLQVTLEQVVETLDRHIASGVGDAEGQEVLKQHTLALLADDAEVTLALRAYAQLRTVAATDPQIADLVAGFDQRHRDALAAAIHLGQRRRLLHTLVEPEHSADAFWTLLLSVAIEVAQGVRGREPGIALLRYQFRTLARNAWVTRPR